MHAVPAEDAERIGVGGVGMNHLAGDGVPGVSGESGPGVRVLDAPLLPVREDPGELGRKEAQVGQGTH